MWNFKICFLIICTTLLGSCVSHVIKRSTDDPISAATHEMVRNMRGNVFQLKENIEKLISKDVNSENEERKAAAQLLRGEYKSIEENFKIFSEKVEEQFTSKNSPVNAANCQIEVVARMKAYQDANEAEMNALMASPVTSFAAISKLMEKQTEVMSKMNEFEQQIKDCGGPSLDGDMGMESQSGGPDPEFFALVEKLTKFDLPESVLQFYQMDLTKIIKRYTESFGAIFMQFQRKMDEIVEGV